MPGADCDRRRWALLLPLAVALALLPGPARADHSLGLPCLTCHALRSTKVVAGSRNILSDNVADPFYTSAFYCGSSWGGGEPLDCGYCHDALGDVANEFAAAAGGANGSVHPVRVAADSASFANGIVCNDCHNGERADIGKDSVPDLTAGALCSKVTPSGYPNHQNVVAGAFGTGLNRLADNPPRLTGRYGPLNGATSDGPGSGAGQRGVDWQRATLAAADLLCFVCHDGVGTTDPPFSAGVTEQTTSPIATTPYPQYEADKAANIATEYNLPGGGHNVAGSGTYSHRLPCYDCHDPHAAAGPDNEALILNGAETVKYSYDPTNANAFFTTGFTGSNDRVVCWRCHDGSYRVRDEVSNTLVTPPVPTAATPVFPFHDNVHPSGLSTSGNCLQPNGGCHQSPHNTNFFLCLDCHSSNRHPNSHASLTAVSHVDSEFGNVGFVTGNGLKSWHDIPYNKTADMSLPANNGCLACHPVGSGTPSGTDAFCLACHDGSGETFQSYVAPDVGRFFASDGHGASSAYDSGNAGADVRCLGCHVYHGSTAYKLLPGNVATTDGLGRVTKTVGAVSSTRIDYTDYTVNNHDDYPGADAKLANGLLPSTDFGFPFPAWYLSNYTRLWTTYSDDTTIEPNAALTTPFGTSGAVRNVNSDNLELDCGDDADTLTSGAMIGFCNACHFSNNHVADTYGRAYTHEGVLGGKTCDTSSRDLDSQQFFFKDCAECHDPHGSGGSTNANLYMIRGKIKHGATTTKSAVETSGNWSTVVFTSVDFSSPPTDDSYDDTADGTGAAANNGDLCAVCHVRDPTPDPNGTLGVDHNYLSEAGVGHQEGNDCMVCHNHSSGLVVDPNGEDNIAALGFGLASTCTGCHGLPPISPCDTVTDPLNELPENYTGGGGAHKRHVDFIKGKLGQTTFSDAWCIPCHGARPGSASWHLSSGTPLDTNWNGENRNLQVDIIDGWGDSASWRLVAGQGNGAGNFGSLATYDGAGASAVPVPVTGPGAKGGEPQACANLHCHGPGATVGQQLLWDQTCPGGSASPTGRSQACAGCHASRGEAGTPWTRVVVYRPNPADTTVPIDLQAPYDSDVPNLLPQGVTANYYRTVSGYGRGGHGDPEIQNEDPGVLTATGTTPLQCSACHNDAAAHFPETANLHRLANTTLENDTHSNAALCNSCHGGNYPGTGADRTHHPSYFGPTGANPTAHAIVPAPGTKILTAISGSTTWTEQPPPGSLHYEQNHYGAGGQGLPQNVDRGLDWWGGNPANRNQSPPPRPVFYGEAQSDAPKASLPLEQYIFGTGTSNRVMCVTCHNPHGTDLYVHDPVGGGATIPDNNMLRLRDEDNTLCNACH